MLLGIIRFGAERKAKLLSISVYAAEAAWYFKDI